MTTGSDVLPLDPLSGVAAARRALRRGDLSAAELVAEALHRIERDNPTLGAFVEVDAERARRTADEAQQRIRAGTARVLEGVPLAVKDMIDVRGLHTRAGSSFLGSEAAHQDAPVVAALRNAGAIIVGKTTTTEFACGPHRTVYTPPARNPSDLARTPGGSSGGSAVAVAAGLVCAAIGTDTAASIRQPAGFCGLVGLRPTPGSVPAAGVVPLAPQFDTVGPLTRAIDDAAILLRVLSGRRTLRTFQEDWRIGALAVDGFGAPDEQVAALLRANLNRLTGTRVSIEPVRLSHTGDVVDAAMTLLAAQAWQVHAQWFAEHAAAYSPQVRRFLETGRDTPAAARAHAGAVVEAFRADVHRAFAGLDALLLPVAPTQPWLLDETGSPDAEPAGRRGLRYTAPWMVTGRPVVAVPAAGGADGMPFGLQLVGKAGGDARLLEIAVALIRQLHRDEPPAAPLPAGPTARPGGQAAVLCVGLQNDYIHPSGANARVRGLQLPDRQGLLDRVTALVRLARAGRWPVIWSCVEWDDPAAAGLLGLRRAHLRDALRTGSWGAKLVDELPVRSDDIRLRCTRFSAFHATDLHERLSALGITRLYVAGAGTDYLVESTVRDAFFHDYEVVLVSDAIQGYHPAAHQRSMDTMVSVFATAAEVASIAVA